MWIVGALFGAIYTIGANDYIKTRAQDAEYFATQGYGPEQIEYFTDYPVVPLVFWTINIVAGLAATALLLARSRRATGSAATATAAQLILQVITFGFMDRWDILGPRYSITDICILLLTALFWHYCRHLNRKKVLR